MPVAASAIAPTRPPGRAFSRAATPTSAPASTAPARDADLGAKDAGLGGEHEEQHDTDERDRDACDGEDLADPVRVTRGRGGRGAAGGWVCRGGGAVAGGRRRRMVAGGAYCGG